MKDARFRDERGPRCMQNSKTEQWMTTQIVMKKLIICKPIVLYNLQPFLNWQFWLTYHGIFQQQVFKTVTNDLNNPPSFPPHGSFYLKKKRKKSQMT